MMTNPASSIIRETRRRRLWKKEEYPLIIVNPSEINPISDGSDVKLMDKKIAEILRSVHPHKYWQVGLYVIEQLRSHDSVNRDTPIIIWTEVDPASDRIIPDAQASALVAGATDYCSFTPSRVRPDRKLAEMIRKYSGRKHSEFARQ